MKRTIHFDTQQKKLTNVNLHNKVHQNLNNNNIKPALIGYSSCNKVMKNDSPTKAGTKVLFRATSIADFLMRWNSYKHP